MIQIPLSPEKHWELLLFWVRIFQKEWNILDKRMRKILLESNAGEQGARMAAMDNASRNAGEMIDNLTLKYNRTRQAFITKELIEIISGAESV